MKLLLRDAMPEDGSDPRQIEIDVLNVEFSPWTDTIEYVDELTGEHRTINYSPFNQRFTCNGEEYEFAIVYAQ